MTRKQYALGLWLLCIPSAFAFIPILRSIDGFIGRSSMPLTLCMGSVTAILSLYGISNGYSFSLCVQHSGFLWHEICTAHWNSFHGAGKKS